MPNNLLKRCPRILIPGDGRWIQYYHPNGGDNIVSNDAADENRQEKGEATS